MSAYDDIAAYEMDEYLASVIDEELYRLSTDPPFQYLARHGDAIEERVRNCLGEAIRLSEAGFAGAAVVRATTGIEVAIHYFLVRPLMQGAFLSEEWAGLLSKRILNKRAVDDRDLLPAILRNWKMNRPRIAGGSIA